MNKCSVSQPVVFLFAGQGDPVIGMGADVWDSNPTTKSIWDCASDISGLDLRRLCLKGPMNRLIQTTVQQLAITAINITFYILCRERLGDIRIAGACGHSVGEYSALYAAGAITLETLFRLIHFRANLMHDLSRQEKGSMLAIKGIDKQNLQRLIQRSDVAVDISCDNSRRQQVVGGTTQALAAFSRALIAARHASVKLGVSGAWHTRLMHDGCAPMRDCLATAELLPPQYPVLMNVTGRFERAPRKIKEALALHLTHTVQWTASMEHWLDAPSPVLFIEMSNRPYLATLLADYARFTPENALHCRQILAM